MELDTEFCGQAEMLGEQRRPDEAEEIAEDIEEEGAFRVLACSLDFLDTEGVYPKCSREPERSRLGSSH